MIERGITITPATDEGVKLNLGCGGRPLPGYINIDKDTFEQLKTRYPGGVFPENVDIFQYDIFDLPYPDGSVDEVRTDSLIEHLSFIEEPKFFREVKRVLKVGGVFDFSTTDFEKIVEIWAAAKDDWKAFFRTDDEAIRNAHWFGQYSFKLDNRWGYLTAVLYGPQNSEGQFHKNCYTIPKIRAILKHLQFEELEMEEYMWKGGCVPMIRFRAQRQS